jgi:hypothetical protein
MARRITVIVLVAVAALAVASISLAAPQAEDAQWHAKYWNNRDLADTPALERSEDALDHDWGASSPLNGVNVDNFSARWTRVIDFEAGRYRFNVTSDDGVRTWVDEKLLIDDWAEHEAVLHTADISLSAGEHQVTVEYFEADGNAVLKLDWEKISGSAVSGSTVVPDTLLPGGYELVDTYSTGFVRGGPPASWYLAAGGQGSDYLWTSGHNRLDGSYNWARWYPTLAAGAYEVFAYIPVGQATTATARYWVHPSGGYTLVVIDQGAYQGQWVSLGRYYFSSEFYEFVSLSNVTFEEPGTTQVAFDAIMWVPVP